jgi:FixJ family two-component response regulator
MSSAQVLGRGFTSSYASDTTPIVFILDEDTSVRESLETFASAQEFLTCPPAVIPNCLVLDASLPGPQCS